MDWVTDPQIWLALLTLTALEIVLGIDNIVFISVLTDRLPHAEQPKARLVGLALAMVMRILLLFCLTWIMRLTAPLFTVPFTATEISGRDLILIIGGLFLMGKSTTEIHHKMEEAGAPPGARKTATFASVIVQIMLLDIVFSLDSVITAIGMASHLAVMVAAVVVAVIIMMLFSGWISAFVNQHPTVKMLALSFLLLIGMVLIGDGLDVHIPKGYIYFAMAFSVFVEVLNLRLHKKRQHVATAGTGPAA